MARPEEEVVASTSSRWSGVARFLEQREPGAERSRLDHEPILIDQPDS
jgi:hypothetical protein